MEKFGRSGIECSVFYQLDRTFPPHKNRSPSGCFGLPFQLDTRCKLWMCATTKTGICLPGRCGSCSRICIGRSCSRLSWSNNHLSCPSPMEKFGRSGIECSVFYQLDRTFPPHKNRSPSGCFGLPFQLDTRCKLWMCATTKTGICLPGRCGSCSRICIGRSCSRLSWAAAGSRCPRSKIGTTKKNPRSRTDIGIDTSRTRSSVLTQAPGERAPGPQARAQHRARALPPAGSRESSATRRGVGPARGARRAACHTRHTQSGTRGFLRALGLGMHDGAQGGGQPSA